MIFRAYARSAVFFAETVPDERGISAGAGRLDLPWMIPDATVMEGRALARLFRSALAGEISVGPG